MGNSRQERRKRSTVPRVKPSERLRTHGNPNIMPGVGGSTGQRGDTLHRIPVNAENEKKRKAS